MTASAERVAYTVCTPDCARANPLAYAAGFATAIEELAEIGYDGVELQVRDPSQLVVGEVAAQLDGAGLTVAALGTGHLGSEDGLRLAAPDDVRRRALARLVDVIDLAAEFDALVTIGSVRGAPGDVHERSLVREALAGLTAHAASVGVRLALEPQNRFVGPYLPTVAATAALIDEAGWPAVGIVADTFHMNVEESSLLAAFVEAGERLFHVQLAENHRGPLGTGSLPLHAVLEVLRSLGYRGWLVMEHEQHGDSRAAASRSLRALELASSVGGSY